MILQNYREFQEFKLGLLGIWKVFGGTPGSQNGFPANEFAAVIVLFRFRLREVLGGFVKPTRDEMELEDGLFWFPGGF